MSKPLIRSSFRYLLRHPWLLVLSILGVAVGVAVVVSIDIANASAQRAFELSTSTVAGNATHQVRGNSTGLSDSVYVNLRVNHGIEEIAPIVDGYASLPDLPSYTMQILGIDPIADAAFRPFVGSGGQSRVVPFDLAAFIGNQGGAILSAQRAALLNVEVADSFAVDVEGVVTYLRVVDLIVPADERSAAAIDNLIVVDISTAQQLTGSVGRLSHIDLILPEDEQLPRRLEAIETMLPEGLEIVRSESRSSMLAQMTKAFRLNLSALSLLALIVGTFLTYNTIAFSVVQRRQLIGRLRAIGATRGDIFGQVIGEALLIGVIGTAVGLLLGFVLGRGLVSLVSRTINDLYYVVSVRDVAIPPLVLVKGIVLGVVATVLSAIAPAYSATDANPSTVLKRSTFESAALRRTPFLAMAGLALILVSVLVLTFTDVQIIGSYLAIGLGLVGFVLVVPLAIVLAMRILRPIMSAVAGVLGRMAAGGIVSTLSRTSVAVAALTIAIAATIGVGVMVSSFRTTVVAWLDGALKADIYVQAPSQTLRGATARIVPEIFVAISELPGVAESYSVRSIDVRSSVGMTNLTAIQSGEDLGDRFRFKSGDPVEALERFSEPGYVIVSEPYAYRHDLAVGDKFTLSTEVGEHEVTISAIYFDYGSEQGVVLMDRTNYDALFADRYHSGVAVYAEEGVDLDVLMASIRERTAGTQQLFVQSNRDLREYSLQVFDRTFTITYVLRLLAILVAFVGILSALMSLQLERSREFAVLRANGMTPGQLWKLVTMQTALLGGLSGLLAAPLGLALAVALIFVINRRAFGWTLQVDLSPQIFLQAMLLAVVAALLAGLYPAWKMSRSDAAEALREE